MQNNSAQGEASLDDLRASLPAQRVHDLGVSAGGRTAWFYSQLADLEAGRGTANFNSACGARAATAYYRRGPELRARPRILVLGGVHATETEGVKGASALIRWLESGDKPEFDGIDWTVCPLLNPDGYARWKGAGFVGLEADETQAINCGTRADGTLWGWPACKSVHPMRGDVGVLGGYFDDGGANLMHDEWHAPFSPLTTPLLQLVARLGPDLVLNMHSSELETCFLLKTWYVPMPIKHALYDLAEQLYSDLGKAGYALGPLPSPTVEGDNSWPPLPAFNLDSMMFHAGATLPVAFESPRGLKGGLNNEQLLDIQERVFRAGARFVRDWYRRPRDHPLRAQTE